MQFTELKQHLLASKFDPCYLIVGEDAFLRESAIVMFKNVIKSFPEINLTDMTSSEDESAILEAVECLPLISDVRVVLVYDYLGELGKVIKYLAKPCASTVLVFVQSALSSNFSKAVKNMTMVDCAKLDSGMLKKWITVNAKNYSSNITADAVQTLVQYCSSSLTRISGELKKLCSYRYKETIESADVINLVTADTDIKIFELSDALGAKASGRVAAVLDSLIGANTPIVNLMGLLYAHFRRMLYCKVTPAYPGLAADLGVKEFAVVKAREAAARFTPVKLKKICDSFHKADFDFKSGKINDRMALDLFIFEALNA